MKTLSFISLVMIAAVGCAGSVAKTPVDDAELDGIDVDGSKADSLRRPTLVGDVVLGDSLEGDLVGKQDFHAYAFQPAQATRVRLDATAAVGTDLYLVVFKKSGRTWTRVAENDDCDGETLNACLTLDVGAAATYRVIVTTYQAMKRGSAGDVNYSLSVSAVQQSCGSRGLAPCPTGTFCSWAPEASCGATDKPGVCVKRPEACIQSDDPVCGCDGRTYGNGCSAASAGVSVASTGACVSQ